MADVTVRSPAVDSWVQRVLPALCALCGHRGQKTVPVVAFNDSRPLLRVSTNEATTDHLKMSLIIRIFPEMNYDVAHFVPCLSTASSSLRSSSDDQPPLETIDAMVAHHLFLQSLFVRPGTCLAIECHFEGRSVCGSSAESKF